MNEGGPKEINNTEDLNIQEEADTGKESASPVETDETEILPSDPDEISGIVREVHNNTNLIEAEIENPEFEASQKTRSGGSSKVKQWLKIGVAGLALGGGVKLAEKGIDQYRQNQQQAEVIKHSEELRSEIIERLDIDLFKIAEEAGFDVSLEVENGSGEYIVHMGQLHDFKDPLIRAIHSDEIIDVQKKIEQILINISAKVQRLPDVFSEGVTTEVLEKCQKAKVYAEKIKNMDPSKISYNKLLELETRLIFCEDQIGLFLQDVMSEKLKEVRLANINNEEGERIAELKKILGMGKESSEVDDSDTFFIKDINYSDNAKYGYGIVKRLFLEGKCNLLPSETAEANDEAMKHAVELRDLRPRLNDAINSEELLDELKRQFDEVKELFDKAAFDIREDIAIKFVTDKMNETEGKMNILVYGNAHDFKDNIEKWNATNLDKSVGLIRLTPRRR